MGPTGIKLYDKAGIMAYVEYTSNDASLFKIHRWVEQRDGRQQWKLAPLSKNIYSLRDLTYMAEIDNPHAGLNDTDKMSSPAKDQGRSFRSINLFQKKDYQLFLTIGRENDRSVVSVQPIFEHIFPTYPPVSISIFSNDYESADRSRK